MSIEFWITSLIVVLVPGTGVIYTISSGLTGGIKKSTWAALGCTLGIVPHIIASLVGLATLLNNCAIAFSALKYCGVTYLLYISWQMWNDNENIKIGESKNSGNSLMVFKKAFLMNILNPKLTIFFLAFLPQFVDNKLNNPTIQMIILSICFMLLTLIVFLIYGLFATMFRDLFLKNPNFVRIMNKSFATILTIFGIQLAISEK